MIDTKTECQCPPFPHFAPGSFASGSSHEAAAHARWEAEHGGHRNAPLARLPEVSIDVPQLAMYRAELRRHLEKNGDALMQIAPHQLKSLLDAAAMAEAIPAKTQRNMNKALAALRGVEVDGEVPDQTGQAIMAARDLLREAGARSE